MAGKTLARRTTSTGRTRNMLPEKLAGARKWDIRSTTPTVAATSLAAAIRAIRMQVPTLPVAGVENGRLVAGLNARPVTGGYVIEYADGVWTDLVDVGALPGDLVATRVDGHTLSVTPVPPPVRPAERVNMTRGTQA